MERHSAMKNTVYLTILVRQNIYHITGKTTEYYPNDLDDNLIENTFEECCYPQQIKLMISGETIRCQKVRQFLRYITFHICFYLPNLQKRLLIMGCFSFLPFIDEKHLQVVLHCIKTD